jgi:hypothetical protein
MRLYFWPGGAQELRDDREPGPAGPIRAAFAPTGGATNEPFGWWTGVSLLDQDGPARVVRAAQEHGPGRVVASSGRLGLGEDSDARSMLRTHTGEGMARLAEKVAEVKAGLGELGATLCLRPGAAEVLSDVPSCLVFLRSSEGAARLVVDPVALLTASMMERADDHLERILSALAGHPGVEALLLTNAVRAGDGLRPVGLHREDGVVDARRLIGLASRHSGPAVDWLLLEEEPARQVELLRMYGPGV